MARCMTGSTMAASTSPLCGILLPRNGYRDQWMVGSGWRWTCRRGCVRMPAPVRSGRSAIPTVVAALETGRTSWTALLDAVRLLPGADVAAVTTDQIRGVVERLIAAGQWQ